MAVLGRGKFSSGKCASYKILKSTLNPFLYLFQVYYITSQGHLVYRSVGKCFNCYIDQLFRSLLPTWCVLLPGCFNPVVFIVVFAVDQRFTSDRFRLIFSYFSPVNVFSLLFVLETLAIYPGISKKVIYTYLVINRFTDE